MRHRVRAWADNRHPSLKDVEKLGQLISEVLRKKAPNRVIRGSLRVACVTTVLFSITRMVLNFHTSICLPFRP
jgi:hypothetical protein